MEDCKLWAQEPVITSLHDPLLYDIDHSLLCNMELMMPYFKVVEDCRSYKKNHLELSWHVVNVYGI